MHLSLALVVTLIAASLSAEDKSNLVSPVGEQPPNKAAAKQDVSKEALAKNDSNQDQNFAVKYQPTAAEGVNRDKLQILTEAGNYKTPVLDVIVEVNENKEMLDKKTIGKDLKDDAEESITQVNKDKQKNQIVNTNEISQVLNDFLTKLYQVPVNLFKAIKDVIKDLTMGIKNSIPKPNTATST